jgi:hypothetical protein
MKVFIEENENKSSEQGVYENKGCLEHSAYHSLFV